MSAGILHTIHRVTEPAVKRELVSMRSRGLTFLVHCATAFLLSCACSATAATDSAVGPADVTVTVNPSNKHLISPYIYGINHASKLEGVPRGLTLDRSGGNRWTAYNW